MSLKGLHLDWVRPLCLPGVWSKGVQLARTGSVELEREPTQEGDDWRLRVRIAGQSVHPRVSLWPEDEDYSCSCQDRADPCMHVAAAAIALLQDQAKRVDAEGGNDPAAPRAARLRYRLVRAGDASAKRRPLALERALVRPGAEATPIGGRAVPTLVALVGGIQSGRIAGPLPTLAQEDYRIDSMLGSEGILPEDGRAIAKLLSEIHGLEYEEGTAIVASKPIRPEAEILDSEDGSFRFRPLPLECGQILERFSNGWVRVEGGIFSPDPLSVLPEDWRALWDEKPQSGVSERRISPTDAARWALEILPRFESYGARVYARSARLPRRVEAEPRIELRLQPREDGGLSVLPELVYARGPEIYARLERDRLIGVKEGVVFARDASAEKQWTRRLQQELHLSPGQLAHFPGAESIAFRKRLETWTAPNDAAWAVPEGELEPDFSWDGPDRANFRFKLGGDKLGSLDAGEVLRAWQNGDGFVRLLSGSSSGSGWAAIPQAWLDKHGRALAEIFEAQKKTGRVPKALAPTLVELESSGALQLNENLRALATRLQAEPATERLGAEEKKLLASLPETIGSLLRPYQRQGVMWMRYRRTVPVAALLADDMGLGKTIQTLAAIHDLKRVLIVAPTSVVPAWKLQVEHFLPSHSVNVYHGPARTLESPAPLTLTTYALLRQDLARFLDTEWDAVVLDEAQAIKNPDSQVARSATQLRAKWRIALSGTPIENRPLELWSLFRFLEPDLLGERSGFESRWATALKQGQPEAFRRLRQRIRPFLLRRLKSEVASELPPKTESVLYAEFSAPERELYDGLFAMARKEALTLLERKESVFSALEALLRLRQACCHPALVPGGLTTLGGTEPGAAVSAKLEVLRETLRASRESGHRVLIFSQWTRLLDLVEPMMREEKFDFLRLDGSTPAPEREARVARFQSTDGPFAFLLSLKAGGTGLTLTAADQVFLLDPWWNPFVEDQAADRAHRIGQSLPVTVYRIVTRGTLEERILALQSEKRALARGLIEKQDPGPDEEGHGTESSAAAWGLSRADIEKLLEPL